MAPITLRSALPRSNLTRSLHSTPHPQASIFFALNALSNARETQHLSKLSGLDRVEHSPRLKLIQTSAIEKSPCPTPDKPLAPLPSKNARLDAASRSRLARFWDHKALAAGRAVLADVARERARMRRGLDRMRRREERRRVALEKELEWMKGHERAMGNMWRWTHRWTLGSIAFTFGLLMYASSVRDAMVRDGADMGGKVAEEAQAALPLSGAVSAVGVPARSWSWKSLFWKQGGVVET
ncbi:hypothetical protein AC578_6535 [Pseudocercospora eumusae]|uniref:Uncharacterized protein n=1 Tax=Pseudocercospora eumusae TaxID=321146 RepID=A0A139HHW1_9PEZI|nr:hypothetical protein AC578_6535 [Pseudocercospora eumusae]